MGGWERSTQGVAARQQAWQIARFDAAREHRPEILLGQLEVEDAGEQRVVQDIVEPHPEPAELAARPVAAERGCRAAG